MNPNKNHIMGQILVESILGCIAFFIIFYAVTRLITSLSISFDTSSIWQELIIRYHNKTRPHISDLNNCYPSHRLHNQIQCQIHQNNGFYLETRNPKVIDQEDSKLPFPYFPKEIKNEVPTILQSTKLD